MKTFESIEHFVNHYKGKKTIPSTVDIIINGNVHTLDRYTVHNRNAINTEQWDRYVFKETMDVGTLGLELKVNYFRYFGEKVLFEAYFELQTPYGWNQCLEQHICPIYFYDKFITEEDYHPDGIRQYSDSLKKWTGLRFINNSKYAYNFMDFRKNAFNKLIKDLYAKAIFQRKCKIKDKNVFDDIIPIPDSWGDMDDLEDIG